MSKKTIGEFIKSCIDELKFVSWKKEDFGINEDLYTVQTSEYPESDIGKLQIVETILNLVIKQIGYNKYFKVMIGTFEPGDELKLTIVKQERGLSSEEEDIQKQLIERNVLFNTLEQAIPTCVEKLLSNWKETRLDRIYHSISSEKTYMIQAYG
jgi:hypothetical protein